MSSNKFLFPLLIFIFFSLPVAASTQDALAVWDMNNLRDTSGMNSRFYPFGDVKVGVPVGGRRGNYAAMLTGGVLNASLVLQRYKRRFYD